MPVAEGFVRVVMPPPFVAAGRWTVHIGGEEAELGERAPTGAGAASVAIAVVAAGGTVRASLRLAVPVVEGRETLVRPLLLLERMWLTPSQRGTGGYQRERETLGAATGSLQAYVSNRRLVGEVFSRPGSG